MATKFTTFRLMVSPHHVGPERKRRKGVGQVTTKLWRKHARVTIVAESGVASVGSDEVRSMIAGAVRREVTRQLRMIESQRESDSLRAVRAYARKVFGSTAKADRWLRRPSIRLGGESPVTWLQHHNDPADVYGALDAIAYGTPV